MWEDPVVKETRQRREALAKSLGRNLDQIFTGIVDRQAKSNKSVVSRKARKPSEKPSAA